MISATGVSFFVDRAGRRPLMIWSAVGMCLCYTVQTITLAQYTKTQSSAASYTFIVFVFIYYISYNIGFMGLLVSYSSEIMPYRIRAKVGLYSSPFSALFRVSLFPSCVDRGCGADVCHRA
jgi:MFS family permease